MRVIEDVGGLRELKKHHSQMTLNEKTALKTLIRGKFNLTKHCFRKMRERGITEQEVRQAINDGTIIEYHLANGAYSRVLLRSRFPINNNVTCVVVDIRDNLVVTAYKNYYKNTHHNTDMTAYDGEIDILENIKNSFNSGKT